MHCRFHLYLAFHLCVCAALSACSSSLPKEGAAIEPSSLSAKCEAVKEWVYRFNHAFPDTALLHADNAQIAHLFRDSWFRPVFGTTYNRTNEEKIKAIYKSIIRRCEDDPFFYWNARFFDDAFRRVHSTLAKISGEYTSSELWAKSAVYRAEHLPATAEGLQTLENEVIKPASDNLTGLLPDEQTRFNGIVDYRKQAILRTLRGRTMQPGASLQYSGPPGTSSEPPTPSPQTPGDLLRLRLAQLEQIPLTLEGRQQSFDWIRTFDQEFPGSNPGDDVVKARFAWLAKRDRIFQATVNDFKAALAAIPAGSDMKAKHAAILAQTFPFVSDGNLNAYGQYLALIQAREKPAANRVLDSGRNAFEKLRDWISDTAHMIVHGSGEGGGQQKAR